MTRPPPVASGAGNALRSTLPLGVSGSASFLQVITISTLNFQSFSQLAFGFSLTPAIIVQTLLFSLLMGFIGGFLPAMRASRLKIVDALRAG